MVNLPIVVSFRLDPIAAQRFRLKQGLVGSGNQLACGRAGARIEHRNPSADADKMRRSGRCVRNLQLRHGVSCMLGKVSGAIPISVGKDEGKLLATITRRHVSGAAAA